MAKPSPQTNARPRLLVLELWGLGDLAMAMPFLRAASIHAHTTLLAKPHAAPLLARLAPQVEHVPLTVPWTAFTRKYRLHEWPWPTLARTIRALRGQRFDIGVSARHDPRDHLLLALAGARRRLGFARTGSRPLLTDPLALPRPPAHRAEYWATVSSALGWSIEETPPPIRRGRRIVIHTGAGHAVRRWPRSRFEELASRVRAAGWESEILDDTLHDLQTLLAKLESADRFIGNDSGPGHLAALLGVPTFTIFGPQLPEAFAPQHPLAAWSEGAPCAYKPCFDHCRFPAPHCLLGNDIDAVWARVCAWLDD